MASSQLTPSSTLSSLPPQDLNLHLEERLTTALNLIDHDQDHYYEDAVARTVMIILQHFFPTNHWNIVPQFNTENGKIPDLVLERFLSKDQNPFIVKGRFAQRIYIELKTRFNPEDAAYQQVVKAISEQHGKEYRSRGFLIGVHGTQWTIHEYHFVNVSLKNEIVECLLCNFYAQPTDLPDIKDKDRPKPSETFADKPLDWTNSQDSSALILALNWLAKPDAEPRNLAGTTKKHHIRSLDITLSKEIRKSMMEETKMDVDKEPLKDFKHLASVIERKPGREG